MLYVKPQKVLLFTRCATSNASRHFKSPLAMGRDAFKSKHASSVSISGVIDTGVNSNQKVQNNAAAHKFCEQLHKKSVLCMISSMFPLPLLQKHFIRLDLKILLHFIHLASHLRIHFLIFAVLCKQNVKFFQRHILIRRI